MRRSSEPVIQSDIANSEEHGLEIAKEIGFPVVLRPAFTLGGTGGGFAYDEEEFKELIKRALSISPTHQVLIEKSIKGFKEIEYEVMRGWQLIKQSQSAIWKTSTQLEYTQATR